jgi:hypothetical protein
MITKPSFEICFVKNLFWCDEKGGRMMKEKLKKYSPLSLLALAIVAGVVAVSTHAPPKKDVEAFEVGYDAGFDVIGYFSCSNEIMRWYLALAREGDTFSVFSYMAEDDALIAKGKPTDFTYLSRFSDIKNPRITPLQYKWNGAASRSFVLDRTNGKMTVSYPGHKANLPGCKGDDCLALEPFSSEYQCKYGEEGKEQFWRDTTSDYEDAYEASAVKF